MFWNRRLRNQLNKHLLKVVFMPGWGKTHSGAKWLGYKGRPEALMLHHTAGAATESTNPADKGNLRGANDGVINYIQNHFPVPAANFTLDRDGTVYVHAANPVWHAGLGSFVGKKPWEILGIPKDQGNRYMMGVEIVSRGQKKDFTKAQIDALKRLQEAVGAAADWPVEKRRATVRRPRHKDWTKRKIDILYTQAEIDRWMK